MIESSILKTKHMYKEATPTDTILKLQECETVFKTIMADRMPDVEISHDCVADENPYFKTINFTTYAGCFIMHPLAPKLAHQQMIDAIADMKYDTISRYRNHFIDKINSGKASKYLQVKQEPKKLAKDLIVLPGTNKVAEHISMFKLAKLRDECDSLAVKPHPLTTQKELDELEVFFSKNKNCYICDVNDDLYELLKGADRVHTTHMSESALYAAVLEKEITSIEKYRTISRASFYHINSFIFGKPKNTCYVQPMLAFGSNLSGVVIPEVDDSWLDKIALYIEYIRETRNIYKGCYV